MFLSLITRSFAEDLAPANAAPVTNVTDQIAAGTTSVVDTTKKLQDVSPTLQYLLEEFKHALEAGFGVASEGIKEICFQIQMFGVGLVILHVFGIILSLVGIYFGRRLWLYAGTQVTRANDFPIEYGGSIVLFILSLGGIFASFDMREPIMMAAAPVVWAIQMLSTAM